jgi:Ca2+/Na+ antiporter
MAAVWLLSAAAAIEAVTGFALIISPQAVASLLLGADLAAAGSAVGRVAGIALLALGVVCWISRQDTDTNAVVAGMLTYNLLVTAYLMFLGFSGNLVGSLLWPAIAIHAVLTLSFAYERFHEQGSSS